MRSTGEVMGVRRTFSEAYLKSQLGANERIPKVGKVFISVDDKDKASVTYCWCKNKVMVYALP